MNEVGLKAITFPQPQKERQGPTAKGKKNGIEARRERASKRVERQKKENRQETSRQAQIQSRGREKVSGVNPEGDPAVALFGKYTPFLTNPRTVACSEGEAPPGSGKGAALIRYQPYMPMRMACGMETSFDGPNCENPPLRCRCGHKLFCQVWHIQNMTFITEM